MRSRERIDCHPFSFILSFLPSIVESSVQEWLTLPSILDAENTFGVLDGLILSKTYRKTTSSLADLMYRSYLKSLLPEKNPNDLDTKKLN